MRVGVLPLAMMHGQRVGQPLAGAGGHRGRELTRQGDLLALGQLLGQGKFNVAEQPPIGALVRVRRRPIRARVVLRPIRHMAGFAVDDIIILAALVLALALDVIGMRRCRLPTSA